MSTLSRTTRKWEGRIALQIDRLGLDAYNSMPAARDID